MTKFKMTAAPLPPHFAGTQQEFLDAFLDRIEITSESTPFVVGDLPPIGNEGPWFKNGTDIYIWDEETSAYIPLDISASYVPQILASEKAPDSTVYDLWLKMSGTTVLGLYAFNHENSEWVTESSALGPGSITNTELATDAITSQKTGFGAVTAAKLGPTIELTKWELGDPRTFARVNVAGTALEWFKRLYVTDLLFPSWPDTLTVTHELTELPAEFQVVRVWMGTAATHGIEPGTEVVVDRALSSDVLAIFMDTEKIELWIPPGYAATQPTILAPDGTFVTLDSEWPYRIYYTAP